MIRTAAIVLLVTATLTAQDSPLVALAKRTNRKASKTPVITNEMLVAGKGRISGGDGAAKPLPSVPSTSNSSTSASQRPRATATAQTPTSTSTVRNIEPQSSARTIDPQSTARTIDPASTARQIDPTSAAGNIQPQATARNIDPQMSSPPSRPPN